MIYDLEGTQRHVLAGYSEGLQVFQHGRHDQFIAVQTEMIEDSPPQVFYLARLGRQDIGNIFGKKPVRHNSEENKSSVTKRQKALLLRSAVPPIRKNGAGHR